MNGLETRREPAVLRIAGRAFWIAGALALACLTLVTVVGVSWRYLLSDPIFGIEDVASISLGAFVAAALVAAARADAHVSLDLLVGRLGPRAARAVTGLAAAIGIGACVLAAVALVQKGSCGRPCGEFTSNLSIPHMPFYYLFAAAFAVYGAILLVRLLRLGRDAPE